MSTRGGGTFEHSCDVGSVSPRRPLIRAPERDADSGNHRRERDGPQVGVVDLAPVDDLAARLGGGVGTHRTRARICSRFPRRTERSRDIRPANFDTISRSSFLSFSGKTSPRRTPSSLFASRGVSGDTPRWWPTTTKSPMRTSRRTGRATRPRAVFAPGSTRPDGTWIRQPPRDFRRRRPHPALAFAASPGPDGRVDAFEATIETARAPRDGALRFRASSSASLARASSRRRSRGVRALRKTRVWPVFPDLSRSSR